MDKIKPFKIDKDKYYANLFGTLTPSVFQKLKMWLLDFGFHCIAVYRFGQWIKKINKLNRILGIIPSILYFISNTFIKTIHHVSISRDCKIGPGLFIMHYYSIIIGAGKIGSNCTIHHNLTIGQRVAKMNRDIAEIGNNVWIGPNTVIVGNIKIGDGSTISAGCVISKDVPEKSLVAGNPGRIIMNDYDNSEILGFKLS